MRPSQTPQPPTMNTKTTAASCRRESGASGSHQWAMLNGEWSMVHGPWCIGNRPSSIVNGEASSARVSETWKRSTCTPLTCLFLTALLLPLGSAPCPHMNARLCFSLSYTHHHKDVNDQYPRPNMSRLKLASSLSVLAAASNRQLEGREREREREERDVNLDWTDWRLAFCSPGWINSSLCGYQMTDTTTTTTLSATYLGMQACKPHLILTPRLPG